MSGLNLSEWVLKHRSFTIFLMIVVSVAGLSSYLGLGRNGDPAFTFRTMVVQAAWPGATLDDTGAAGHGRLERKLQETRASFPAQLHHAGRTTIFVSLRGRRGRGSRRLVSGPQEHRRHAATSAPAGVIGPGFNDDFGDTRPDLRLHRRRLHPRELRDYVEQVRSQLLNVPDVSKIEIIGAQDEADLRGILHQAVRGSGIDRMLIAAIRRRTASSRREPWRPARRRCPLQVSGAFRSEQDILDVNFVCRMAG